MATKLTALATAAALAAGIGSGSAAEGFAALDGIAAEPMSPAALATVRGKLVIDVTRSISEAANFAVTLPMFGPPGAHIIGAEGVLNIHFYPPDPASGL